MWIDPLQNFIDLDSDKEEHHEEETLRAYSRNLNFENGGNKMEEPGGGIPRRDNFPY